MAKAKKEEVVEKTTEEAVETKGATEDGKLKVKKKKPSMKSMEISDEPIKVDMSKPPKTEEQKEEVVEKVESAVEEITEEIAPPQEDEKTIDEPI